jgi:predicted ABC-type ATPase
MPEVPQVVILAGPNGAGKSTTAPQLLRGELGVGEFVNADVIARGLSEFTPEGVAIYAGRIMLTRIHELAAELRSFAFETTLASRSFVRLIRGLKRDGYCFHLLFLWLPSPEMAANRVAERIRHGGHSVPVETIRRRYFLGLTNLRQLYLPLADKWSIFDNSKDLGPQLIASGGTQTQTVVKDALTWAQLNQRVDHENE